MAAEQPNNKKSPCAQDCWPMCERVEEYHIFIALRSWDFSGHFDVYGIF